MTYISYISISKHHWTIAIPHHWSYRERWCPTLWAKSSNSWRRSWCVMASWCDRPMGGPWMAMGRPNLSCLVTSFKLRNEDRCTFFFLPQLFFWGGAIFFFGGGLFFLGGRDALIFDCEFFFSCWMTENPSLFCFCLHRKKQWMSALCWESVRKLLVKGQ